MGFGGHVLDMINRQKANRDMQKHAREKLAERRRYLTDTTSKEERIEEEYSEEYIQYLKERMKQADARRKLAIQNQLVAYLIVFIITIALVVYVMY